MRLTRAVAHEGQGEEPVLPWTLDENRDLGATRLGFTPGAARARKLIFGLDAAPAASPGRLIPPPSREPPRPTKYTTPGRRSHDVRASRAAMALFESPSASRSLGQVGFGTGACKRSSAQAGHVEQWRRAVSGLQYCTMIDIEKCSSPA